MAIEILPIGTNAATSTDVTIPAGEQMTVAIKSTSGPQSRGARVAIQIKADNGEYFDVDELTHDRGHSAMVIVGAGTYRFSRIATGAECGVFRD